MGLKKGLFRVAFFFGYFLLVAVLALCGVFVYFKDRKALKRLLFEDS